ncbi:hypothetical protein [Caballeronia sp. NCTM1]|uniref:hypothetical protein n=1 Tax=Caballeronia sp. NCTM1 TaxID=2921753 RepID=UPI0020282C2C|nr:hypothetical protein [Caballeronia sp. NCTM1]
MNWLSEYFLQKTSPLTLYLWAYPPLSFGPEGPLAPASWHLSHAGLSLTYVAGGKVEAGGKEYALPARYEGTQQPGSLSGASTDETGRPLIRLISIIAPSSFNSDFTVRIDDAFAFTPVFATDGSPGFVGTCMAKGDRESEGGSGMKLPWFFQGYLSI